VFEFADWELHFVAVENYTAVEYCLLREVEHPQTRHMFDVKSRVGDWGSRRASGVATGTATMAAAAHSYSAVRWCSVVGALSSYQSSETISIKASPLHTGRGGGA
jgi:hypothetical protein